MGTGMNDEDDDIRDAMLFRFWVRAGSEFPGETAVAIAACHSADDYRAALTVLARRKGINLP
jgi:hypothetical protein